MRNKQNSTMLIFLCCCIGLQSIAFAQTDSTKKAYKTENAIIVYAGGGGSFFTGKSGVPAGLNAEVENVHLIGSLRVMWHPGHLLHIGLETGSLRFYSYTIDNNGKKGTTQVDATPIFFVLSMPVNERIEVFAGTGNYFMQTKLDYQGQVKSNVRSIGWMVAASYRQPLGEHLGIGAETKWMNSTGTKDALLSLQIQLAWKFKLKK